MEEKRSAAGRENIYAESPEEKKSFSMDMAKIFQALKPKVRNLLWLAYVEGYGIREIAEITGAKPNTVKTQLFRARKKLAGLLKKKKYLGGA
jgi:RNA polymerase sigma-70 factor (ECF subfamily)